MTWTIVISTAAFLITVLTGLAFAQPATYLEIHRAITGAIGTAMTACTGAVIGAMYAASLLQQSIAEILPGVSPMDTRQAVSLAESATSDLFRWLVATVLIMFAHIALITISDLAAKRANKH